MAGGFIMREELDLMAQELMGYRTLAEKEMYLIEQGRIPHIEKDSKVSKVLSAEDPDRFCKIGSYFYYRKEEDSDRKYRNICRINGEYLYEKFPLIFEFYDEYINDISYEDSNSKLKVR